MEIKGEDFIKKVQLKQEETEIEQRLSEIKNAQSAYQEQQNHQEQPQPQLNPDLDREVRMQEEQEYSDIMLGKTPSSAAKNSDNKKKYLVLGLVLVILFLLTIIIIRLLTNDSTEDESFSKATAQKENTQTILEDENIEEQYQKIINEKLKNIKEENNKEVKTLKDATTNLDLEKIEEKEKVVKEQPVAKTKPNVFDVKKTVKEEPKPVVKKQEPKPVVKKAEPKPVVRKAKSSSNSTITQKPSGTFVQVGAFSKMPNSKYLDTITKKGFKYKIYKVSINNKMFHKVLIGPYNSRGQAKLAIDNIKKQLNISGAFILTF
ncbi:MAG: SPOR domain-containing protein [Campylobacteraceae bacterium]|nr:SPOR domain-containing protein [Campylobacteraceae bacterium]